MVPAWRPWVGDPAEVWTLSKRFHFISGLPRSGSTLMGAILRQNPRFSAGMSSPVASLFDGIVSQVSAGTELSRMITKEQTTRILRGVFDNFYNDDPATVIFDTNRAWTARMAEVMTLFPDAKFICCVRNVSWIMDSMERQYRENAFENTLLFNNAAERSTVYTRTEALAAPNRLVGFAYQALREACYGDHAEQMVMIDYDIFVQRPADVIKLIYQFLGEEMFEHDFDNVNYDAPGFDVQLGLRDLHTVKPKVAPQQRSTILPPDVFQKYKNLAFWQDLADCRAFRIVNQPSAPT